ncbi:HAD family hydrolase [Streptacidiphilus jiangxiensis]|uniref:Putative hydrolase of the HAD superfamily n=1 Tax=Streptacidiphilus jiangxiensis TaxID=235985 RepID=A0A1H7NRA8_STRJI|nr:HAD-IA family hydrolase [Streptacidiphilus jiangxiensis]SEL26032.1 putative hydrolase of the HAD superfamily [Streptacidiphilus jiangxiensis]
MSGLAFDALLCDLDGVIRFFDLDEVTRLEQAAGIAVGTTMATAFAAERGRPLVLGRLTRTQWAASIAEALTAQVSARQAATLARAFAHAPSRADQQAVELIRRVRRTIPVVLVTNATVWLDDDLGRLGLTDLADHVVNSSRVRVAKPDLEIYQVAAERAGAPAHRCAFVDDSRTNVDAARQVGMSAVHYRRLSDLRELVAPVLGEVGPSLM